MKGGGGELEGGRGGGRRRGEVGRGGSKISRFVFVSLPPNFDVFFSLPAAFGAAWALAETLHMRFPASAANFALQQFPRSVQYALARF